MKLNFRWSEKKKIEIMHCTAFHIHWARTECRSQCTFGSWHTVFHLTAARIGNFVHYIRNPPILPLSLHLTSTSTLLHFYLHPNKEIAHADERRKRSQGFGLQREKSRWRFLHNRCVKSNHLKDNLFKIIDFWGRFYWKNKPSMHLINHPHPIRILSWWHSTQSG